MTALLAKAAGVALAAHPSIYASACPFCSLRFLAGILVAGLERLGASCAQQRFAPTCSKTCCFSCEANPASVLRPRQFEKSVLSSFPPMSLCSILPAGATPDGAGVTYNERINVALAVAMPDGGLITPVLKVRLCMRALVLV